MTDESAHRDDLTVMHFLVSDDITRSKRFYTEVLSATVARDGEPLILKLANSWIVVNSGGGPTTDKPTVTLETPRDLDHVSSFLNLRVGDIHTTYREWSQRGGAFLTPPVDHGREIRAYLRDPDGHLIEVGQAKRG